MKKNITFNQKKMTLAKVYKFIFICGVLILVSSNIFSKDLLFTGPDSRPPKYYTENGKAKGFVVDITKWVLNDMGQSSEINLYPWKRAYTLAINGKVGVIGLSMTSKRLKIFDYSDPLYYGDLMIVVKKGKEFPFKVISDLKGKRIVVGRGASYGDAFDKAVKEELFKLSECSMLPQGLKMVLSGRVDALLIGPDKHGIQKVVDGDSELQMNQFSVLPIPFKRDAKHLGFHKSMGMKSFLKKFNLSLKKAWETGVVDKIVKKYYK